MKANRKVYAAGWKPFLGVLLAVCFLATAAHAGSIFTGTFELKNEVRWGKAVLGPGSYSVVLDNREEFIIISDAKTGKIVARELASPDNYKVTRDSELLIIHSGNQRVVTALRLTGFGEVFQNAHPFPVNKRAAEEARNTETVPVEMARR